MLTQNVTTTGEILKAEQESFTAFFELLSTIDQRLIQEDPEYRAKYYSDQPSELEGQWS